MQPDVTIRAAIGNLADKAYCETQNYFESRVTPTAPAVYPIHGIPGHPIGLTVGATIHFGAKR